MSTQRRGGESLAAIRATFVLWSFCGAFNLHRLGRMINLEVVLSRVRVVPKRCIRGSCQHTKSRIVKLRRNRSRRFLVVDEQVNECAAA